MRLSLSGKVALITGGSRGIGAAAVRMFVAAGARVFFSYEKSKQQAEQLVKELGADNCAAVACNLSGTETARDLVASAVDRFGRLDILVANHGVWPAVDDARRPDGRCAVACPRWPSTWTACSRLSSIPSLR